MLRLTRTAIGLLTRQYRSVLKKCWAINVGIFALGAVATTILPSDAYAGDAYGTANDASGQYSVAFGIFNGASGNASSAFGDSNGASGQWASAFGHYNTASGYASSAFGAANTASGDYYSSAFGTYNTASGQWASAFGAQNTASGVYSSAFGYQSNAAQDYTTAIGYQAVANVTVPLDSNNNPTQGIISVGHKNGDPKGTAAGGGNYTSDYFSRIINVANGTDAHDAATVGQMNTAISGKADKATTLSGYGITNAYTKTEVDDLISQAGGSSVDLSDYYTKSEVYNKTEIDDIQSLNNYYRKNKKSGILNGFEEGEKGNEIGDNFSKSVQNIKAVNDNFVSVENKAA